MGTQPGKPPLPPAVPSLPPRMTFTILHAHSQLSSPRWLSWLSYRRFVRSVSTSFSLFARLVDGVWPRHDRQRYSRRVLHDPRGVRTAARVALPTGERASVHASPRDEPTTCEILIWLHPFTSTYPLHASSHSGHLWISCTRTRVSRAVSQEARIKFNTFTREQRAKGGVFTAHELDSKDGSFGVLGKDSPGPTADYKRPGSLGKQVRPYLQYSRSTQYWNGPAAACAISRHPPPLSILMN